MPRQEPLQENKVTRLNVGGHWYETKMSTLKKIKREVIEQMVKGIDESYFLDRDGKMFQYILEFFRSGNLCLPNDFSEFDSLTTEVKFFNDNGLSQCLEKIKQEKILVRYLEVLETTEKGIVKILMRGKEEDLIALPFFMAQKDKLQSAGTSPFVEITLYNNSTRLRLAEHLTFTGWTRTTSDFSSSSCVLEGVMITEHSYRDIWKK